MKDETACHGIVTYTTESGSPCVYENESNGMFAYVSYSMTLGECWSITNIDDTMPMGPFKTLSEALLAIL